jgi:hypothetical protein
MKFLLNFEVNLPSVPSIAPPERRNEEGLISGFQFYAMVCPSPDIAAVW